MRAEFSDFNVDGLKKFQNSKKYVNPNPYGKAQQGFDFNPTPQDNLAPDMADFLTWDVGTASNQTNPSQSTPTQDFTEFNFEGSQAQEPLNPFDIDPFAQVSVQGKPIESGNNFWEIFGGSEGHQFHAQAQEHSVTGQSQPYHQTPGQDSFDPFSQPGPGDKSTKSAIDELMQLSIEPKKDELQREVIHETTKIPEQSNQTQIDHKSENQAQQQMAEHRKPDADQKGANSFLDLELC